MKEIKNDGEKRRGNGGKQGHKIEETPCKHGHEDKGCEKSLKKCMKIDNFKSEVLIKTTTSDKEGNIKYKTYCGVCKCRQTSTPRGAKCKQTRNVEQHVGVVGRYFYTKNR